MTGTIEIYGTEVSTDEHGRYRLNDLHKASGGARNKELANWLKNKQTKELVEEIKNENPTTVIPVVTVNGGVERGTYATKELVYAYAMWVSPKFNLAVIRAFDEMVFNNNQTGYSKDGGVVVGPIEDKVRAMNALLDGLNVHGASRNISANNIVKKIAPELAVGIPTTAIDAPSDSISGSSVATFSVTESLSRNGVSIKAAVFNKTLQQYGILEKKTRPSTAGSTKEYWCVTKFGLKFGKNITSVFNARETFPHYFESKFIELLEYVNAR